MSWLVASVIVLAVLPGTVAAQEQIIDPAVQTGSDNWNGYVADSGYFTVVGALMQQLVPNAGSSAASSWVGIGGNTTSDLIQAGISTSPDGSVVAWYELLPAPMTPVFTMRDSTTILDVVIADMGTNNWQIILQEWPDIQSAKAGLRGPQPLQVWSQHFNYVSCHCSAEWIVEPAATSTLTGQLRQAPVAGGAEFWRMFARSGKQTGSAGYFHPRFVRVVGSNVIPETFPDEPPGSNMALLFGNPQS
ncbi:MAG TPA: G1 family glutamic endopeptidase [Chloroflexota bacterium]|nr:G1 family glutamic endopeptidase [Chloroflexota bacterium]